MGETGSVRRDLDEVLDTDTFEFLCACGNAKVKRFLEETFDSLANLGHGLSQVIYNQVEEEIGG